MKKPILALVLLTALSPLRADPLPAPVLERYEQMLLESPEPGTAFDKVYQHYLESEGLEALAKHWNEAASAKAEKRADYLLLAGLLAERLGKSDEALVALQGAVDAGGGWRAWSALAASQARAGKLAPSIESYRKAISLSPAKDALPKLYRGWPSASSARWMRPGRSRHGRPTSRRRPPIRSCSRRRGMRSSRRDVPRRRARCSRNCAT